MEPRLATGLAAALLATLIGSGWQIASRHGVTTTLGPLEVAVLRYGIPAVLLAPLWWRGGLRPAGLPPARLALFVLSGGLPFGLLVFAGLQWAPAAHVGIFMSGSVPLFTALLGRWSGGKPLRAMQLVGLLLVTCGLALAAWGQGGATAQALRAVPAGQGTQAWHAAFGAWRGDGLFLLAALSWAVHTLTFRSSGLTAWQGAALVNGGSALLLLPIVLLMGAPRLVTAAWTDVALQALGQGVVAGLLGLVAFLVAVRHLGAERASLSAALVPLVTSLGAAWLLGEPLGVQQLVAAAVVAVGVALAGGAWRPGTKSRNCA